MSNKEKEIIHINIPFSKEEHENLLIIKEKLSWRDFVLTLITPKNKK